VSPLRSRRNTTAPSQNENNYLLFQIVKDQPNRRFARKHQAAPQQAKLVDDTWGAALTTSSGGANRDRTDDLLLAKQALSQLSYGPVDALDEHSGAGCLLGGSGWIRTIDPRLIKTVL
jgi:hypothetical protein